MTVLIPCECPNHRVLIELETQFAFLNHTVINEGPVLAVAILGLALGSVVGIIDIVVSVVGVIIRVSGHWGQGHWRCCGFLCQNLHRREAHQLQGQRHLHLVMQVEEAVQKQVEEAKQKQVEEAIQKQVEEAKRQRRQVVVRSALGCSFCRCPLDPFPSPSQRR